jgi:hypothetical protein
MSRRHAFADMQFAPEDRERTEARGWRVCSLCGITSLGTWYLVNDIGRALGLQHTLHGQIHERLCPGSELVRNVAGRVVRP